MTINNIYDYHEAGFIFFDLHSILSDGSCGCGRASCTNAGKHPKNAGWQHSVALSEDDLEGLVSQGAFSSGFGVLCAGYIIIDVDARNGGVKSFEALLHDVPELASCGYVVDTGSGGGSKHYYWKIPPYCPPILTNHKKYPGIDFKASGFVVGAGSWHVSGAQYEVSHGYPQDVTDAPHTLIGVLRRPTSFDVLGGACHGFSEVSEEDLSGMLRHINPDCDYDRWIRVGMALHHCTGGAGFELWDHWSSQGAKYPKGGNKKLLTHWQSFGRSSTVVTFGTLHEYATEGGWYPPVMFDCGDMDLQGGGSSSSSSSSGAGGEIEGYCCMLPPDDFDEDGEREKLALDDDGEDHALAMRGIDILNPPGFVGDLARWIEGQNRYPRRLLSVAAALTAVSSLAGMRCKDEKDNISGNIIAFGVAGAGTGKESVMQSYQEILRIAGVQAAVHGKFKSEQELIRNLIRHQAAFYCVDEFGEELAKLTNSKKKGGASYLEGIIGTIMSVYSKATGYFPVSGDLKEEIREKLLKDLAKLEKKVDEMGDVDIQGGRREMYEGILADLLTQLKTVDMGIENPYLTLIGFTTPVVFDDLMTFEMATNGFMARALIFPEGDTHPKIKKHFKAIPMEAAMVQKIRDLWNPGFFDSDERSLRICYKGEKNFVTTTPEACELLEDVSDYFYDRGLKSMSKSGLEAIPRRGYEIAAKVSFLLAIPEGVRTVEHVAWAFEVAKQDIEYKLAMAYAKDNSEKTEGLVADIIRHVESSKGITLGVLANKMRKRPKEQVRECAEKMAAQGMIKMQEEKHPFSGAVTVKFYKK